MKAISFLGFSNYQETTYVNPVGDGEFTTPFFQEALVEFYKPNTLYVLLTKTVETCVPKGGTEPNWELLKRRLEDKVNLEPIYNVPEESSTNDIWKLFEILTNCLEQEEEVIFDITNGYRSLPVLALIAISYLRVVRNLKIRGLIYGAWEARNKETNKTPIFDLMPIVSLLEWTTATDQFIKTGNGESLSELLSNTGDSMSKDLAGSIKTIAQSLQLLRPMDIMRESAILPKRIELAVPTISKNAPEFDKLLDRVEEDYSKFKLENPEDYQNNAKESLVQQLKMIQWYKEKGQIVQALSMAREWLPSLLCYHFNLDPLDKQNREEMELLLNGGAKKNQEGDKYTSPYLKQYKSDVSKAKRTKLLDLWSNKYKLANLRNDVLHSGFRKNPKSAEEILKETEQIIEQLEEVAKDWELK